MTDTSMSVEHGAVSSHVSQLHSHHHALQHHSTEFMSAIEPLTRSWKGDSVTAWNQMTEAWDENMKKLTEALNELTGRVDEAGKTYKDGESNQLAALRRRFAGMHFNQTTML